MAEGEIKDEIDDIYFDITFSREKIQFILDELSEYITSNKLGKELLKEFLQDTDSKLIDAEGKLWRLEDKLKEVL